ncbi:cobyrinic acid a,c-diamide synthase [Methanohalobium evestigatum Z-7303]|uniref:Cobyrinate a,c-diamide synthase n=1 Tax=Methanohalobium evestigatum (strain ATCC BAA-1072 / DSM 3721 / NBRC 107634 / OCM 161 / Z-7303) TaxID=644295 RepID=D7E960_METEZ|nr:cobyrinate a,c-diamide synthase [Methanohalobium evestigatum]ADI74008.1 cobyrinic acid a,c-diamide synthase [Methanohalobium evestigatum Z-7303]
MTNSVLIAGTHSGVGKTTVSMGIMAALSKRNLKVQPYKVGPDYIDPTHHTAICKKPSRNLDTYMMDEEYIRRSIEYSSNDADISVIEGVMGLYDGVDSTEISSSAHVAKVIGAPVILVVNVHGMSRSVGAILKGYSEYDKDVNVAGVVLNKVGSQRHAQMIKDALPSDIPVVGALPKNQNVSVPSRHLGLHMASEEDHNLDELAEFIEENIDLDAVMSLAREPVKPVTSVGTIENKKPDVTIGVGMDGAFCFYYQDMLDSFRQCGADIEFFSPVQGELPDVDGIYLGGGYPELYIEDLEKSKTTSELKNLAADGMPIYGECGGMQYLCSSYEIDDVEYKMADVFPANTRMTNKLKALGHTKAEASGEFINGTLLGHEFHYSTTECSRDAKLEYEMIRGKGIEDGKDGLSEHNSIASYMHAHPATFPVDRFVDMCRKYSKR